MQNRIDQPESWLVRINGQVLLLATNRPVGSDDQDSGRFVGYTETVVFLARERQGTMMRDSSRATSSDFGNWPRKKSMNLRERGRPLFLRSPMR